MHELDDMALLREFVGHGSESAFAELVTRHVNKVYSVALRHTRNPHTAEEITQAVFVLLARKAGTLGQNVILSGWLYQTARLTAVTLIRSEIRRAQREQEVLMQTSSDDSAADSWPHIAPLLDDAMAGLSETDRHAVVLRYFDGRSLKEVGAALGGSEDAAKMRVNRAVEKLRTFFSKHGVTLSATGLTMAIAANSVQSAPVGLATAVTTAALSGTTLTTSALIAATKTIAMTALQKTLVTVTVAMLAGAGIYEARQAAQLRGQNQSLQQQQAPLAEQIQQLQRESDNTTNRLTDLLAENSRLKSNPNQNELLKLRGEVGRLRQQLQDLPSARAELLRQKLAEMPDKKIPELKYLTEKDWINAAWNADLNTDDGVRLALSKLRDEAVDTFLGLTRTALKKYLTANGDILPTNLLALKSYYDTPVTDEMLQRYAFMQTGKVSSNPSESVIRKAVYADSDYDSNQEMSMSGGGSSGFNLVHNAIYDAAVAYTVANNGQTPNEPAQLAAYLKRPVDAATLQKYFDPIIANMAANSPPTAVTAWLAPAVRAYLAANNGQPPKKPSDLLPFVSTPEQQAELQKLDKTTQH